MASGGFDLVPMDILMREMELEMAIADNFPEPKDSEAGPHPGQDKTATPTPMVWDRADTLERLGGDEGLLQEVIEIFLTDIPKHMASLQEAITNHDAASLEQVAHTVKGEVGYMGIATISNLARELEEGGRNADFARAAILYASLEPLLSQLQTTVRGMRDSKIDGRPETIE
ncbi:MAG: Hpt domain-containing protein [Acidobacteriaceae bacterium]